MEIKFPKKEGFSSRTCSLLVQEERKKRYGVKAMMWGPYTHGRDIV